MPKISALPAGTTISGAEETAVVQSGVTVRVPVSQFGPADIKTYATLAAAAAATIGYGVDIVETLGHTAAGDNGGARYSRIATTTAAAWRFTSADGQMWSLLDRTVTPEMFGVFEGADTTAAWNDVESWLNLTAGGLGGATLNFKHGAVYDIWPAGTTPSVLVQMTGCNGITINFNGAKFETNNLFSPQGSPYVLVHVQCSSITINDPWYEQTAFTTLDPAKGGYLVYIGEDASNFSHDITVNHGRMTGGIAYFLAATSAYVRNNSRGVFLNGAKIKDVYYGINAQGTPHGLYARGIECDHVGRGYFPYNVTDHKVELIGNGGDGHDFIMLKCYAVLAAEAGRNVLSNIDVTLRTTGMKGPSGANASRTLVALELQQSQASTAAAEIRNITIRYDVEDGNGNGNPPAFVTGKYTAAGAADTTTRGYVIDNVILTGVLKDYDGGINVLNFFTNTGLSVGDFTGETINNVGARDLVVDGASGTVLVNATDIDSFMPFENVSGPAGIVWTVTDPSKKVRPLNTSVNGLTDHRAVVPSTAVANQFVTGIDTDGALTRDSGVATPATASTLVARDANGSSAFTNITGGYTTTATAAGTTTLTVASNRNQFFTGTTTQTVTLPVTSTLALGHQFLFENNSIGLVTVQSSGGNTVATLTTGTSAVVTCILTSGTGSASWHLTTNYTNIFGGKLLSVQNTLTFSGTDGSTVAFGAGGTVAYTANKLSAFAATTSVELAGVISDETGSGSLVFGTSPTITTPNIVGTTTNDSAASGSVGEYFETGNGNNNTSSTVTMTIASPCVVTWTTHKFTVGAATVAVKFTTTGALPTGITSNATYYLKAIDANTFNIATSAANALAGTFINTSGSQSGVHTGDIRCFQTAAVQADVAAITLGAGDWDVGGQMLAFGAATTAIGFLGGNLSLVSGAVDRTVGRRLTFQYGGLVLGNAEFTVFDFAPTRFSLASSTTIFLVADQSFTTSTYQSTGWMRARRVR